MFVKDHGHVLHSPYLLVTSLMWAEGSFWGSHMFHVFLVTSFTLVFWLSVYFVEKFWFVALDLVGENRWFFLVEESGF